VKSLEIAQTSLIHNIIQLEGKHYLSAGQHQFKTLWTRDFAHSCRGLLLINRKDVAWEHLEFLLANMNEQGLAPRVADNYPVQWRVIWAFFKKVIPGLKQLPLKSPLKCQYRDEHGSFAFDSNLLILHSAISLGGEFLKLHESKLSQLFNWYDDKFHDDLITQPAFSDWQDTSKRKGKTFLTNFYYFLVATQLKNHGWEISRDLEAFKFKIKDHFLREGVFSSLLGQDIVSVEGNLMAIVEPGFLDEVEKNQLWLRLKNHPIVKENGFIGRCSYPNWPSSELAWHVKFIGLHQYHGGMVWSWLLGLGLSAACEMNDQEMIDQQYHWIEKILLRDQVVYEIYDPLEDFLPWKMKYFSSEYPFSWGASYLIEGLSKLLDSHERT
jgi:hypothetical protein